MLVFSAWCAYVKSSHLALNGSTFW